MQKIAGNNTVIGSYTRNKCERVTAPQPERVRLIFAGVNATRTSGTGPERNRNANRNRCEHGQAGAHSSVVFSPSFSPAAMREKEITQSDDRR